MSTLADAIKRTTRNEPTPIGFSPSPSATKPTMLLVALVPDGAAADAAGADALLTRSGAPAASNGSSPRPLRGAWLQGGGDLADLKKSGVDFIVFNGDEAPAAVLLEEDAGLVMQAPDDLPDSLLQALQWLPLDALLVRWEGVLTVRRQLDLQRLSGFARKPLLLVVGNAPPAGELEALREAGVIGLVVDLSANDGVARLKTLRTTIDGLRPRPKRSRGDSAIVSITPSTPPVAAPAAEPDDDEE